jgi:hypothetical protein
MFHLVRQKLAQVKFNRAIACQPYSTFVSSRTRSRINARDKYGPVHLIQIRHYIDRSDSSDSDEEDNPEFDVIESTKKWIDTFVVRENLCPYVLPLLSTNRLRFVASKARKLNDAVSDIAKEARLLIPHHKPPNTDTESPTSDSAASTLQGSERQSATLISFDAGFVREYENFENVLQVTYVRVLLEMNYNAFLHIWLFHPKFIRSVHSPNINHAPGDYAMRSPFPTLLLLPEAEVRRVMINRYLHTNDISYQNKLTLFTLGARGCRKRFDACYVPNKNYKEKQ